MTITGSPELTFLFANIWSGDDTAYTPFILQCNFSCNLAAAIQILKIKGFLISADLKNRVG